MFIQSTNEMYNQYKMLCAKQRLAQSKYEKQQFAFNEIIKYIQTTIPFQNVTFIEKIKTYSWNFLTVSKERITSFDDTRLYYIEKKYRKLCDESRNQEIEKWINQ